MDKLRVAVIGAGQRGHTLALCCVRARPDAFELLGVCDVSRARAEWLAGQCGSCSVYDSIDAVVGDPRIEAVFVTTCDSQHVEPAVKAMAAGKHVYCEKPLATTLDGCDAIIEAARSSRAVFYMGFNMRWAPFNEKAKEVIDSGALGALHTAHFSETYFGGRTYFRRWNRLRRFGGGLWITKATHDFDIMHFLLDRNPIRVAGRSNLFHYKPDPRRGPRCGQCQVAKECPNYWDYKNDPADEAWRFLWETSEEARGFPGDLCLYNSDKDTFDHGVALLEFEGGLLATYNLSVVCARTTRTLHIQGDRGELGGDTEGGCLVFTERFTNARQTWDLTEGSADVHGGSDVRILEDFRRCVQEGAPPRANLDDGRWAVRIGLAVRDSCDREGEWMNP